MLRFCCCCFSGDNSNNERRPLLDPRPSEVNVAESARQTHSPACSDAQTVRRIGRLVMRRLCVPELDQRFLEMAETFNEQQEGYEAMALHIRNLQQSFDCAHDDTLTFAQCLGKIRDEQEATYRVSLKMKGYDFFLNVVPVGSEGEREERPLPPRLQMAQNELKRASDSTKVTISKGTILQELIGWLLRSHDKMAEKVKGAAETYQERGRLSENLEENMREVRRAKELSQGYRQQAAAVLTEAAQIAGAYL
ncbi:uncharacterized protein LOC115788402 [Archocentrus centrarchus]|uniref:uncharacterized protein LOC115788402 n=1 Tax=Archocentrus centrarchus TaxID=63155 RepID=UPI0011E9F3B0|nr:uncharacterized protein LOC115788402 [Archocentrus centrarchus]